MQEFCKVETGAGRLVAEVILNRDEDGKFTASIHFPASGLILVGDGSPDPTCSVYNALQKIDPKFLEGDELTLHGAVHPNGTETWFALHAVDLHVNFD